MIVYQQLEKNIYLGLASCRTTVDIS